MPLNFDFFNPWSSRFYSKADDGASILAAEASRNSWGVSDTFDQFDARVEHAHRVGGVSQFSAMSLLVEQTFKEKSHRIAWYRQMANVPIIKKCLTIMSNDCVSPDEKGRYALLGFTRNFKNALKDYQIEQLQTEFDWVLNVVLKADEFTLWDLFHQWLTDGEMFWEIVPSEKGDRVIRVNVLNPCITYPIYQKGRIIGFVQSPPSEWADALGIPPKDMGLLKFRADQIAYSCHGKYGSSKQDVKGWLDPSVRSLNQLMQMEDALLAVRVNRAVERLLVNVSTGLLGANQAAEVLNKAKAEYNKSLSYDTATGRVLHRAKAISLKEMFWFAVGSDGVKTSIESLQQNTTLNGQIEDVKIFEKNVYDALEIAESRRGGDTDATYSNKHELSLQEMQMALSARRLSDRFAQNLVKKVFVQHLALRGFDDKYVNGNNYVVSMSRNNYYEKSRIFEMNATRGELANAWGSYLRTEENKNPLLSRRMFMTEILQFPEEFMALNDKYLKKEESEAPREEAEGGDDDLI